MLPTSGCDVNDVAQCQGLNAKVKENYLGGWGGVSSYTVFSDQNLSRRVTFTQVP